LDGLSVLLAKSNPQRFAFFNSLARCAYESVYIEIADEFRIFAGVERRAIGFERLQ